MLPGKRNPGQNASAAAAAPAPDAASLERLLKENPSPEKFCAELCKTFRVRATEIALLQLEKGLLRFLHPEQLKTAGTIPVSSSSSIAAHTAVTRKVELFNTFAKVKHASIFEKVRLDAPEKERDENQPPEQAPIQKLMSAPVLNHEGKVLGVIQVCRKAFELSAAGRDFDLDDLHHLELAAKALAQAPFMRS